MGLLWETENNITDKCSIMHARPIYKLATRLSKIKNQSQQHKNSQKPKRKTIQNWKSFTKNIHKRVYDFSTPTSRSHNVLIGSRVVTRTTETQTQLSTTKEKETQPNSHNYTKRQRKKRKEEGERVRTIIPGQVLNVPELHLARTRLGKHEEHQPLLGGVQDAHHQLRCRQHSQKFIKHLSLQLGWV